MEGRKIKRKEKSMKTGRGRKRKDGGNKKEEVKWREGMEEIKDENTEEKGPIHTAAMGWYCRNATSRCVMSRRRATVNAVTYSGG
jgi:hypothetical protein